MKIGLITYDRNHKKTQDIMLRLMDHDVTVIAMKYKERKKHKFLYKHRPDMDTDVSTVKLCEKFGFDYVKSETPHEIIKHLDVGLVGGCGLIKAEGKIINSHPGYLSYGRGLDALKWSIYNGHPIGVSTHVINDEVDSGYLIEQRIINVSYYDSFYSVAMRQYEMEIEMLSNSIYLPIAEKIYNKYPPTKRMPMELEPIMMDRFKKLKK